MFSRQSRIIAVVLATGVLLSFAAVVTPASAVQTAPMFLSKTQPAEAKYGPIPGNFPPAGVGHTPGNCGHPIKGTVGEGVQRTCDNVPITIEDPQLGPTEDYLVTFTITWEPNQEVQDPGGKDTAGANDLDIYLYDDRQLRTRKAPSCAKANAASEKDDPKTKKDETDTANCYTEVGHSATAVQPEVIKLFSPEPIVNYNMVVVNFAGPNISYTVKADMKIEGFDYPFEDLGPSFGGRANRQSESSDGAFAAPTDLSGDDPPGGGGGAAGDVGDILAGGRTLDEVPVLPDRDFGSGNVGFDTTEEFAAPTGFGGGLGATRAVAPAGPVSGALLAFWMVLVPIALVAGGVFFVIRRSRRAFTFA